MYAVKVSASVSDLTGIGLEYLVDRDNPETVRAKFFDGTMVTDAAPSGNSELTASAA